MVTVTETIPVGQTRTEEKVVRFDIHQKIQHWIMMLSFTLLVVTGLPLKFHDWAFSQWWVGVWGGVESTRTGHHVAAWALVIVCVYHAIYLFHNTAILKKPFPVKMLPSRKDFADLNQEMRYFVGLTRERPKFDRFNWREKFDYWAIFWGMPVMAGSGFIMMFPTLVVKALPGWVVPAALVAHSDEAMLALIWIFLVHVFFNHFSPGILPINTSIFTGKVPKERYLREHPLEYERLFGTGEGEHKSEESG